MSPSLNSSATSAKSYWNKPEKTKATFIGKCTKTGDKYVRYKKGIYTYCGRTDDMMKVSGQYVSPFEIETVLQSHEKVLVGLENAFFLAKKIMDKNL